MRATVYFHGPATNWAGKVMPAEIVGTFEAPWLWLVRLRAKRILKELNTGRCGYVIHDGEAQVEHVEATNWDLL